MLKPLLALVILAAAPAARAEDAITIRWDVSEQAADRVNLRINSWSGRNGGNSTTSLPLADLKGLASLAADGPVRFQIVREAGRLDCDGVVTARHGAGGCRFTADPAFAAALEKRGVGRPSQREQLEMTTRDVRMALLDAFERQGYRTPTPKQLVAAGVFRIDVAYLRSLDAIGYHAGSLDKLTAMRIFRIEPDWIRQIEVIGPAFRDLPPDTLVAMRIHHVSPEFARRMLSEHPDLTPARLVELRIFSGRLPLGRRAAVD